MKWTLIGDMSASISQNSNSHIWQKGHCRPTFSYASIPPVFILNDLVLIFLMLFSLYSHNWFEELKDSSTMIGNYSSWAILKPTNWKNLEASSQSNWSIDN